MLGITRHSICKGQEWRGQGLKAEFCPWAPAKGIHRMPQLPERDLLWVRVDSDDWLLILF